MERVAFHASAGLITFDEVPLGNRNPIYTGSMHGNDLPDMVVRFGGYFEGQRLGGSHECPEGANLDRCVLERPDGPLALELASPPTVVEQDGSNPESPALSGTPVFNGPVAIWFSQDVAAVGLVGGYFNGQGSTAIQAYARDGSLIGGVVNLSVGMEFLALATEDGTPRIAGIQFSLVGNEPAGYAVDTIRFALPGQYGEAEQR